MHYSHNPQITIYYFFVPNKQAESSGNIHCSHYSGSFLSINLAQQNPVGPSERVLDAPRPQVQGFFRQMISE